MKIALFVDELGNAVPFSAAGTIELYEQVGNIWICSKKVALGLDEGSNLEDVRGRIYFVKEAIEESAVFVVETIKSVSIAIFEANSITVWKHIGKAAEALDYIKTQEKENRVKKQKSCCCDSPRCKTTTCSPQNSGKPVPTSSPVAVGNVCSGIYEINLAKVLGSDSTLNSKQILIPFFQDTVFSKLDIVCDHVPKWFEKEFTTLKLEFKEVVSDDGLCHAIVTPRV